MAKTAYDVAVIGAGVIGCSVAYALALNGRQWLHECFLGDRPLQLLHLGRRGLGLGI
jgi:2-polyprenyl-6-methoxyphenol hydroxylase-like FAD-dependent oxidoreductase